MDGDTITLVTATSGTYDTPNAGSGKTVTATGLSVGGASNGAATVYGYGLSSTSASAAIGTITPAPVSAVTQNPISLNGSRTYDGTADVAASIFTLSGLVSGQDLTLTGVGTVADKNVGVNKPVSLGSLALGNGNTGLASNYTFVGGTYVATITPATLSVAANNLSKPFAGSDPLLTFSTSGLMVGDSVAAVLSGNLVRSPGETTGLYGIGQGTLTGVSGNYSLAFTPGSFRIVPRVQSSPVSSEGPNGSDVDAAVLGSVAASTVKMWEPATERTAAQQEHRRTMAVSVVDDGMRLPEGLAAY